MKQYYSHHGTSRVTRRARLASHWRFIIAALLLLLFHPLTASAQEPASRPAPGTEFARPTPALPPPAAPTMGATPAGPDPVSLVSPAGGIMDPPPPAPSIFEDPIGAARHLLDASAVGATHDLSPWSMFLAADWVVKAVMLGLAFASLMTWTVWLAKTVEIACAGARARRALAAIAGSSDLSQATRALVGRGGPGAIMVRSAEEELRRSLPVVEHAGNAGVKERVVSRLARIEAQAGRRLTRGTGILATIGSTAPFVGLFGTVWGIMNAFIGISRTQTTNLAVVAPGIAEALLATAIGLVAAIPAVVIYNLFARAVAGYRQRLADAAAAVERLVSLELDWHAMPARESRTVLTSQAAE